MAIEYVNEYNQIGESTTMKCFHKFAATINGLFGQEYLHEPNLANVLKHM
jgi:hypothetical protein